MGETRSGPTPIATGKAMEVVFLAGFITAMKSCQRRKSTPLLPPKRKERPQKRVSSPTYKEELQSVASQRLVNDPENTGNVWLRVDQLGRTVKCLTEDNAKLLEEKNILIKEKRALETALQQKGGEAGVSGGSLARITSIGAKPVIKPGSGVHVMAAATAINAQHAAAHGPSGSANGSLSTRSSADMEHHSSLREGEVKHLALEADLRRHIKELQDEVQGLQRERGEAAAELSHAREDQRRLEDRLRSSDQQMAVLRSQNANLLEESQQLKNELVSMSSSDDRSSGPPSRWSTTSGGRGGPGGPEAVGGGADAQARALQEARDAWVAAEKRAAAANERIKGLEVQNKDLAQEVAKLRVVGLQTGASAGVPEKAEQVVELERVNDELTNTVADLKRKNSKLSAKLKKVSSTIEVPGAVGTGGTGARGDSAGVTGALSPDAIAREELQERVDRLQAERARLSAENSALQRKVVEAANGPSQNNNAVETLIRQLQEQKSMLQDDNARLQSKIQRLNKAAPAVQAAQDMLEQLRKENELLHEDNNKLVAYIETLPPTVHVPAQNARVTQAIPPGTDKKAAVDKFVDLRSENQRLQVEIRRLVDEVQTLRSLKPHISEVPVILDTNEHLDKEMWALLEDLRVQNRLLLEENSALRKMPPMPPEGEASLQFKVDMLKQQLKTAMESKASDINEDNLRLLNTLVEENRGLEEQVHHLLDKMVERNKGGGGPGRTGAVLQEVIKANERIAQEKHKVHVEMLKLAGKVALLMEDKEALSKQVGSLAPPTIKAIPAGGEAAASRPHHSMMWKLGRPFRRNRNGKSGPDTIPRSAESEDNIARLRTSLDQLPALQKDSPLYGNLLPDLVQENVRLAQENLELAAKVGSVKRLENENTKLMEENHRLGSSVADLVKELSEENEQLASENRMLANSMEEMLMDNRDLAGRLVDAALSGSIMGGDAFASANNPFSFDADAHRRRNARLAQELEHMQEEQAEWAARRADLANRTSSQLQELHSRQAMSSTGTTPSPDRGAAPLPGQEAQPADPRAAPRDPGETAGPARPAGGGFFTPPERSKAPKLNGYGEMGGEADDARRRRVDDELRREDEERRLKADRSRPSSQALRTQLQEEVQSTVSGAYIAYAHEDDVDGFMASLGFGTGERPPPAADFEAGLWDAFQRAIKLTEPADYENAPPHDKVLAAATRSRLIEWLQEYEFLLPMAAGLV